MTLARTCKTCFGPALDHGDYCGECVRKHLAIEGSLVSKRLEAGDEKDQIIDRLRRQIDTLRAELDLEKRAGDHLYAAAQAWQRHAENRAAMVKVLNAAIQAAAEKGST